MVKIKFTTLLMLMLLIQSCSVKNNLHKEPPVEIKEAEKIWGIDISHYQEIVDWNKLREQEPGFIFVKATEGSTFQDPKYTEYYKTIRKLDIPVGSYHFFTYKTSGKDQAKNFLSVVKYQHGDLPLVLDAEFAKTMPEKGIVRKELQEFMTIVYNKTGIYPIIYCAYKYYNTYLRDCLPTDCKLWIVDYKSKPDCNWTFWQTTEKYKVGGIKGYVDFNLFYGSKKKLKSLLY
ncbi:MAG: GH25 family lysozyme [Bacteroidota bacterium]|nr:GH25 family lysozyme [Bacteroidota bacterium]